jgi:hypothetical protein
LITQQTSIRFVAAGAILAFALAGATALSAEPDTKDNWYLAVGHGGHRMFSRDGKTWEKHVSWGEPKHDQNDLNVAVNYKGTFFAGGGYFSGRLTATRDGELWSDGVIPKSSPIFGLEVLGDVLYAVDLRGVVFKTTDGEKWELVAAAEMPTKTHWIRGTAQGNGLIVGSGDFGPAIVFDPATGKIVVTQMDGQVDKNPGPKRVTFGNGVFVVCGQSGLLAVSKDGKTWQNNKVDPERGDVQCVEFTGKEFLASTKKGALSSTDGLNWKPFKGTLPNQVRLINGWLYGYAWPRSKFSRSKDGMEWEPIPNEKQWEAKNFAFGPLAGGAPPAPPSAPKPAK